MTRLLEELGKRLSGAAAQQGCTGTELWDKYYEGKADGLREAIWLAEDTDRTPCETVVNNGPPEEPGVWIRIPIAYLSSVAIDGKVGPEIFFDEDAVPKNWEAASVPVDLPTAIRAAELLEAAREVRE